MIFQRLNGRERYAALHEIDANRIDIFHMFGEPYRCIPENRVEQVAMKYMLKRASRIITIHRLMDIVECDDYTPSLVDTCGLDTYFRVCSGGSLYISNKAQGIRIEDIVGARTDHTFMLEKVFKVSDKHTPSFSAKYRPCTPTELLIFFILTYYRATIAHIRSTVQFSHIDNELVDAIRLDKIDELLQEM
jgi:hypothetical protein